MNPWEEISLDDYESHMSLDSVRQLQALNELMGRQLADHPAGTVTILGIAGGNGLEHVSAEKYRRVYCVDVNAGYLSAAAARYPELSGVMECLRLDLVSEAEKLPRSELVIADLLIEYIGCDAFRRAVRQSGAAYVSCVIQINSDVEKWVSESPYLHAFDGLGAVHHQMEEGALTSAMAEEGYAPLLREVRELPGGKALVRLDFGK